MPVETAYRPVVLAIDRPASGDLVSGEPSSRRPGVLSPPPDEPVPRTRTDPESGFFLATVLLSKPIAGATELRSAIRKACERLLGPAERRSSWIGAGVAAMPADEAAAERRAIAALSVGKTLWKEPRTVLYQDVMVFDVLRRDLDVLRGLAALLDPLVAHDAHHGTELVETLEAFSEAELSQIRAARRLGVHRHTVGARLRQAERILGHPVRSGPDRLLMELAPKARRLLASVAAGT